MDGPATQSESVSNYHSLVFLVKTKGVWGELFQEYSWIES